MKVIYVLKSLPNQLRYLVLNQKNCESNAEVKKQSASSSQKKSGESASSSQDKSGASTSSLQTKSGASASSVQEKCAELVSDTSNSKVSPEIPQSLSDSITKFRCTICEIALFNKAYFLDHWKKYHPEISEFRKSDDSTISITNGESREKIPCKFCEKRFYTKHAYYYHRKKFHPPTKKPRYLPLLPEKSGACALQEKDGESVLSSSKVLQTLNDSIHIFRCEICDIVLTDKATFFKHWEENHPDVSQLFQSDELTVSIPNNSTSFEKITCPICQKILCKSAYYYHKKKVHPLQQPSKKFPCDHCNKGYSRKFLLSRHKRLCHNATQYQCYVTCVLCKNKIIKTQYSEHAFNVHNITVHTEELKLSSLKEFVTWKESIEHSTKSKFLAERSTKNKVSYYACHRSGFYTKSGKQLRKCKAKGSNKINGYCPAAMVVYKSEDGTCKVKYTKTHVGHDNSLDYLRLTKKEKDFLAAKIAAQVPFDTIIEEVRNSAKSDSHLQRIHVIKRKDLHNIAQIYKLPIAYELQINRPRVRVATPKKASKRGINTESEVNETTMLENMYDDDAGPDNDVAPDDDGDPDPVQQLEEVEFNVSEERVKSIQKMTAVINSLSTKEEFEKFDKCMAAFEEELVIDRLKNQVESPNFFDFLKS